MAESYVQIPADGSTTVFNFNFDYLDTSHVTVLVDGVDTSFSWLGTYSVSVSPAPASGKQVRVRRTTPRDEPVVNYTDGSVLVEADLDATSLQMLYVAVEAFDAASETLQQTALGVFDALDLRIANVGPATDQDDAVTVRYIEDNYSTPFASVQAALTAAALDTATASDAKSATAALHAATQILHDAVVVMRNEVAANQLLTAADVATSASNKAQTALDVATTAGHASSTASDRTQTGLDAAATAADRAQVALDAANVSIAVGGSLLALNNLSDLTDVVAARTNMGIGVDDSLVLSQVRVQGPLSSVGVYDRTTGGADGHLLYTSGGVLRVYSLGNSADVLQITDEGKLTIPGPLTVGGKKFTQPSEPNLLVNGDFQVWQRGTTFANAAGYTADRWYTNWGGAVVGMTVSRQPGSTNSKNSMRLQRDGGTSSVASLAAYTAIRSDDSYAAQGKKLTLTYRARCGADYSALSSVFSASIRSGPHTDVSPFSVVQNKFHNVTLTTAWQEFTLTTDDVVPETDTQVGVWMVAVPVGTAGANDWIEVEQVKLEASDVPTEHVPRPFNEEFALCQQYFQKSMTHDFTPTTQSGDWTTLIASSYGSSNAWSQSVEFYVPMRTSPTITLYSSSLGTAVNRLTEFRGGWVDTANNIAYATTTSFYVTWQPAAGTYTAGDCIVGLGGWTADAEL